VDAAPLRWVDLNGRPPLSRARTENIDFPQSAVRGPERFRAELAPSAVRHFSTDSLRTDARRDDHSSRPRIASRLQQPTRGSRQLALASLLRAGWASPPLLFGLAPRGVCRAPDVAIRAVGSYPTFSPLPNDADRNRRASGFPLACRRGLCVTGGLIFCGTFRGRAFILQ